MQTLIQDVRFAMRMFRRRPAFMLSILTVLGFAIGSSTTIFSVVDGVLLKPLPYRDPENLVRIFGVWQHGSSEGISAPHFRESRSAGGVFESIAAAASTTPLVSLTAAGDPEQIVTRSISAGFFSTLGVQPLLGREFLPEEEVFKGPRVVLLSFDLWRRQYAGETKIVGRALKVNNYPYTIVGVMPPVFNFLGAADLFTPLQQNPYQDSRSARTLVMIGRLKAGATLQQAQQQLDSFALNQQAGYPGEETGWSAAAMPLTDEVVRDVKPALTMLVGAVALVLLVASSNVAGMMLSQTTRRTAEISLRHSLGASKTRVLRQLLTESLTLALAGGALGCLLAIGGVEVVKRFGPAGIPRLAQASVDLRVLLFAFLLSAGVGVLVGLEPAWRASRTSLAQSMAQGSASLSARLGLRDILVVGEVALSMILVIGAGLLVRTRLQLERVNPGFEPTNILTTRLALPGARYAKDGTGEMANDFWRSALERVEAIPGVMSAGITSELPLGGLNNPTARMASAGDGRQHLLYLRSVSPHFLETLRVPVLAGRGIGDDDRREAPRVVVINDQFRKDVFGDIDPIGKVLTFNFRQRSEDADYQAVVVGVVGSIRHTSLAAPPFREAYMPEAQSPGLSYDLVVRSRIDPHAIAAPMRTAIWSVDADQGIGSMRTFEDVVDGGLSQPRFRGHLLAAFALAGLALAAVGLYGLLGARVDQGRREIGIRMAMGASPQALLRLILGRGMTLTLGGIVIGLSGSLLFSRLLSTLVFGIAATDPATFASGATVLALAGFAASYLPARRATRLDPVVALRHE